VLLLFRMIQIQDGRPAWHLIDRDIFNFFMNPTSHEVTRLARNTVFFFTLITMYCQSITKTMFTIVRTF